LFAKSKKVAKVEKVNVERAELVRVVLSEGSHDVLLLIALLEDYGQTLESVSMGLLAVKPLNYKVVNNFGCLLTSGTEEPAYFKEVQAVGSERVLEPINTMEEEGIVFLRSEAHLCESLKGRRELLARLL